MQNYTRTADMNIPRMAMDVAITVSAFPLAVWATCGIHAAFDWKGLLWMPLLYGLVFLYAMHGRGLYEAGTFTYQDRTLRGVTASCLAASALCTVFLLFMPRTQGNTDILAFHSLIGLLLMGLRYFITLALSRRADGRTSSQLLLVGMPQQMQEYLYYLDKTSFRVNPVGYLCEPEHDAPVHGLKRLGAPADLEAVLENRVVDEVVIACPRANLGHIRHLLGAATRRGIVTKVALDVWTVESARCHVSSVGPLPVLVYHKTNLSSLQQSLKRGCDLVNGLLGLSIFLLASVVIVPISLLANRANPFVLIKRAGRNGRPFRQLRYRVTLPGRDPASRLPEDRTALGRFLFRTRLHYLPSFWNVFTGDMSVVGTRGALAMAPEGKTAHTVSLKPGITGLWHVRDFDRTLDDMGLQALDNEYAERWNLLLDMRILLLTPLISVIHRVIGHVTAEEEIP